MNIPHLVVPGNHDPESMFERNEPFYVQKLEKTTNLHFGCYELSPGLWIAGLGGSVPGQLDGSSYDTVGYPFTTCDMNNELTEIFRLIPENAQVIIILHCPPNHIGSSFMDVHKRKHVYYQYGSESLYQQLKKLMEKYSILLVIHGHVHHEPGVNWLHLNNRHCCFVNPGAIM